MRVTSLSLFLLFLRIRRLPEEVALRHKEGLLPEATTTQRRQGHPQTLQVAVHLELTGVQCRVDGIEERVGSLQLRQAEVEAVLGGWG